jgi:copper chaperone
VRNVVLRVPDISCEHCERTVKGALGRTAGVRRVDVDIPAKEVRVEYDEAAVEIDRLKAVLAEEDYPVASVSRPAGS